MSRSIGNNLPDSLRELLGGSDLARHEGHALLLLTVSEDGWPHVAMLSLGEVLAVAPDRLRAGLWPTSTSTHNLSARGTATLLAVHDRAGYSIRCSACRGADIDVASSERLAYFELSVTDVLEDIVPYAELTSGVTFRLVDPEAGLARWQERIEALRAVDASER